MMVVFVSRSEGRAITTVRNILDSFALRIGTDTWKTVITAEGLLTVKTVLRRNATKSTAVSCHWIRSRSRSELLWIVGKRSKFNAEGMVPVHSTSKAVLHSEWENDWQYAPAVKALAAMAALFHDWGKASDLFQEKLRHAGSGRHEADPFRHEWISCKLVEGLVEHTRSFYDDEVWLNALAEGNIEPEHIIESAAERPSSLKEMPPIASILLWLIVSHHRMPADDPKAYRHVECSSFDELMRKINATWGYSRPDEEGRLQKCFSFSRGILWPDAAVWKGCVQKWARRMLREKTRLQQIIQDKDMALRNIMQYARLSLMLADHYVSSLTADRSSKKGARKKHQWSTVALWANTDGRELKQGLEEHIVLVMEQAVHIAHQLPYFAEHMEAVEDLPFLKKRSPRPFQWQDTAADKIRQYSRTHKEKKAYFIVNMASTGCGKTTANAKIMQAVSETGNSLRYVLALGLRTLTLQTGDEYRNRIGLDKSELAVIIGSSAVQQLHEQDQNRQIQAEDMNAFGKEEMLLEEDLDYIDTCNDEQREFLQLFFHRQAEKYQAFLYKPVAALTIDYLMKATETIRGGKYMLPFLRLMSSDLVIDEIDDFDKGDLIAVSRLVHMAGMLGRSVAVSSATIPPDLAQGMFYAYTQGLACYNRFFTEKKSCAAVFCDEFKTVVERMALGDMERYKRTQASFIDKRVKRLEAQPVRRKGRIWDVGKDENQCRDAYFESMRKAAETLHDQHYIIDEKTKKHVSFGIVRLANITPCVACSRYFLQCAWPDGYAVRIMTYHSRQFLIMRHEQERYLDKVLKRKYDITSPAAIHDPVIRRHLDTAPEDNVLFIVVSTPVEELGRDHDFDWAVVEPSSYRSLIQLAGRLLRHRIMHGDITTPNMAVMQYNLRGWRGEKRAFYHPGYEEGCVLNSHNMHDLIDEAAFGEKINAVPRIKVPETLAPESQLADLEHQVMKAFNSMTPGPQGLHGWSQEYWWLTALPQKLNPFRASLPEITLYGVYAGGDITFCECQQGEYIQRGILYNITFDDILYIGEVQRRFWLQRDYIDALRQHLDDDGDDDEDDMLERMSKRYGEITIPDTKDTSWRYSDQFGLFEWDE